MGRLVRTAVAIGLALATGGLATRPTAASLPGDDKAIAHVVNRIAYGPRAGDLARVREMGLQRYIDRQLHPDQIADAGMSARLSGLPTVVMSARQIAEQFERPQLELRRAQRQQAAAGTGNQDQPLQPTPEMRQRANQVVIELSQQKLLRAIYSERQLQEVLADFWFNHFNVDARKGRDRFMLTDYEREAIRPRVLDKFRNLLEATAQSPAMLFYLDNWMSADPNGPHIDPRNGARAGPGRWRGRAFFPPVPAVQNQQAQAKRAPRGLNENYGRELMELHTLGVDGGYTQKDVTEVARCFTGWTIEKPRENPQFKFDEKVHDPNPKVVLGKKIHAGGMKDGEQVIDQLVK